MRHLALRDSQTAPILRAAAALGDPLSLDAWLRSSWLIVPDPLEYEYVVSPALQLQNAASAGGILKGDCDDAATLAASILTAMGWPCRLIAIRKREEPEFSHVFVRCPMFAFAADDPSHQWDIDPIVPAAALPLAGDFETMIVPV